MTGSSQGEPTSLYDAIGGEVAIQRLVTRFYDLMDSLPEAKAVRAVHPSSLDSSREKLFLYLTGWLGGPPLYTTKYGHPRLRARHLHAPIGPEEITGWLVCFEAALEDVVPDERLREAILPQVRQLAMHMRNQD